MSKSSVESSINRNSEGLGIATFVECNHHYAPYIRFSFGLLYCQLEGHLAIVAMKKLGWYPSMSFEEFNKSIPKNAKFAMRIEVQVDNSVIVHPDTILQVS